MNSIYRKLLLSFLALNLVAIGTVGVYSYYKEKEALLSRTFDQLITVRQEKKQRLTSFFTQRINDLKNLSSLPSIEKMYRSSVAGTLSSENFPPALRFYLKVFFDNAGCYKDLYVRPLGDSACVIRENEKNGIMTVCKTKEKVEPLLFHLPDTTSEPVIKEVYTGSKGAPVLVVEKIIKGENGRQTGVLALTIQQKAVNAILFENTPGNGLGKTGEVYLVGSDTLMHSQSRFVQKAVFRAKVNTTGALQALQGNSGTAQFRDYRHIPVLSAFSPFRFSGLRWAILAEIDTREAMVPIYSIRDNIIYLSLLMALISAAVITFLAKKIADPIKRLQTQTTQIAAGKYGDMVRVETKDEIGDLTRAFNEMSVKLKVQSDRLEEEKTLRLKSVLDAQEEERQRFSMELHDGLGPLLLAGKMKLENALQEEETGRQKAIREVLGIFAGTIREIRNISSNMRPSGLKEFGLAVALEELCSQTQKNYPLKVHCHIDIPKKRYGKTTEIYLYRIAQEGINNVVKHARASEINLNLEEIENHLYMTLWDNGSGFDAGAISSIKGNGLANMKARVNLLHGFFELTTRPGKGTRIEIDIPVL